MIVENFRELTKGEEWIHACWFVFYLALKRVVQRGESGEGQAWEYGWQIIEKGVKIVQKIQKTDLSWFISEYPIMWVYGWNNCFSSWRLH